MRALDIFKRSVPFTVSHEHAPLVQHMCPPRWARCGRVPQCRGTGHEDTSWGIALDGDCVLVVRVRKFFEHPEMFGAA